MRTDGIYSSRREMFGSVPLTTHHPPDELTQFVVEYQMTGSQKAKNNAAKCLVNFVWSKAYKIARTVSDGSVTADDLYSAGWLGFLTALEKFKPAKGYQFFSYVKRRIIGAMLDERRARCHAYRRRGKKESGTNDEARQEFENEKYKTERSLDETYDISDSGEGTSVSLLDIVLSTPSHLETLIAREDENATWAIAIWALSRLDPRERYVLIHYFVLGRTLASIGDDFDRSESLVLQLKKRAVAKIDNFLHGTPLTKSIQKKSEREFVAILPKSPKPKRDNALRIKKFIVMTNQEPFWCEDDNVIPELRECLVMFDLVSYLSLFTENARKFKRGYVWLIERNFIRSIGDIVYKVDRGVLRHEIDQHQPTLSSREKTPGLIAIRYVLQLPIWDVSGFRWRLNIEKARAFFETLNALQPV